MVPSRSSNWDLSGKRTARKINESYEKVIANEATPGDMRHWRFSRVTGEKTAGGPGSGVAHNNTAPLLERPLSNTVRIGSRRAIMESNPDRESSVSLDDIKYVAQKSFTIKKLSRLMDDPKGDWKDNPIKLYYDGSEYHLMDGHHRFLAALRLGMKSLPAKVWEGHEKKADFSTDYGHIVDMLRSNRDHERAIEREDWDASASLVDNAIANRARFRKDQYDKEYDRCSRGELQNRSELRSDVALNAIGGGGLGGPLGGVGGGRIKSFSYRCGV